MFQSLLSTSLLDSPAHDETLRWLVVAGAGLLVIYVLMRPRKKKDPLIPSSPRLSLSQQKAVERQMESLLVEFSTMARQMSAQLDTRSTKLELLIKEADEKLAALRAATAAVPDPTARGSASWPMPIGNSTGDPIPDPQPPAPEPAPPPPSIVARHADVYGLADQGETPQEIARQLGRSSGEVELILALRSKGENGKVE